MSYAKISPFRYNEVVQAIIIKKRKGDNNMAEDKWKVTYKDIEGKYIFKINGFGKFMEMLKSKVFLGILIILIILSIVYNNNLSKKKLIRKEKRLKYERK